jgi:hypothetical protein
MTPESKLASMDDRRTLLSPKKHLVLFGDRLECHAGQRLERRIALDQIQQVRLAVEMAGSQTQVVCRVTGPSGEIVFGSRAASGSAFEDNALDFQGLLVALHRALAPRYADIAFVEGQSLGFRLIMCALGLVMGIMAAMVSAYILVVRDSVMLAFAGFPFLVIGGYLAWVFRPAGPAPYDPAALVTRFSSDRPKAA